VRACCRQLQARPVLLVGKGGFEPPASASRTLRANQAALLPVSRAIVANGALLGRAARPASSDRGRGRSSDRLVQLAGRKRIKVRQAGRERTKVAQRGALAYAGITSAGTAERVVSK